MELKKALKKLDITLAIYREAVLVYSAADLSPEDFDIAYDTMIFWQERVWEAAKIVTQGK